MKNIFQKLCQFYLSSNSSELPEDIKKMIDTNSPDVNERAKDLAKKLKKKVENVGFKTDFVSFCDMIEYYINNKKDLSYEEKKEFLKLLISLSKVYEVNLREELSKYSNSEQKDNISDEEIELFYRFCRYNLEPNNDVNEFNALKDLAVEANLNYKTLQKQSLIFVEDIKIHIEKLNLDISENYFDNMLNEYMLLKSDLSTKEKIEYLKILLYLSEIYDLNLREIYTNKKNDQLTQDKQNKLSNLLDNKELLGTMMVNRYDNGYFDIKNLYLKDDKLPKKSASYNVLKMTSDLMHRLYSIFVDKLNNYAFDDLNTEYANLIGEEEIVRLSNLTREEIYEILELINKKEPVNYIVRKYKLTSNLYKFINRTYTEITDFSVEGFGLNDNNLFNPNNNVNDITIHLNGPAFESHFIINEYIRRCVENNVNYELSFEQTDTNQYTYLYASVEDINIKLSILDEIGKKHHNIIEEFGNPLRCSIQIDNSYYGITNRYMNNTEYNSLLFIDYFNFLSEVSYYRVLAKIVLPKIEEKKALGIIEDFINLKNIEFDLNEPRNPIYAKYNGINFEVIKDLVNQYIPLVINVLNTYMDASNQKETIIEEFKKSLLYLHNKCLNIDKNTLSNISLLDEFIKVII